MYEAGPEWTATQQLGVHLGYWVENRIYINSFCFSIYFSPQVHPPSVGWMVGPFGLTSYSRRYTLNVACSDGPIDRIYTPLGTADSLPPKLRWAIRDLLNHVSPRGNPTVIVAGNATRGRGSIPEINYVSLLRIRGMRGRYYPTVRGYRSHRVYRPPCGYTRFRPRALIR